MNKYMKQLSDLLYEGLEKYANSEEYQKLLSVMSKFHSYSANNCLLIATQCPDASYIAGYNKWHNDFHRQVKKGAHAIRIKSPMKYEDKESGEEKLGFKASYVFDIADTYQIPGKPEVKIGVEELHGFVKDYNDLISCLTSVSPVPVRFENFKNVKKHVMGYYNDKEKVICVRDNLSELQSIKTLIHEIARSLLHTENPIIRDGNVETARDFREFEAESVAFMVCKYLNLETGEYSFPYILSWSKNQFQEFLKEDIQIVQKASNYIIEKLNEQLKMVDVQA